MNRLELLDALKAGTVEIGFTKVDGTTRLMLATLDSDLVQSGDVNKAAYIMNTNDTAQPVWDTQASGWRSFKWNNVVSVDGVKTPGGIKVK